MSRNGFAKFFLILTVCVAALGIASNCFAEDAKKAEKPNRPNILMITCHDLGQHVGCYGTPNVQTPNLDKLANKGVRFENFYSTSCVCSPARGCLHTGRYPQSNGLVGLTHAPWWWSLNKDEKHTAKYLKELGYETYLIGLCHIGKDYKHYGYDHRLSKKQKAPQSVKDTLEVFKKRKPGDKPFFIKLGFREVHRPFEKYEPDTEKGLYVPPWLKDSPQTREDLALYQGTIKYFDAQVGTVLDALEKSPLADDTLVIFTSDHGIPYVGAKWTLRKTGIEVPFIVYQPGTKLTGGKVYPQLMSHVDVLPTLLDLLGQPIPEKLQGLSFKGVLEGKVEKSPREAAYSQFTPAMKRDNESRSIVTDRYHLIWYVQAGRSVDYPADVHPKNFADHVARAKTKDRARPVFQLYDLKNDPDEMHDIASKPENAKIVEDLAKKLMTWMKEVDDPIL
ncbi:MAG: sulfatase, partial [Planctomycetia bacterium]